MADFLDFLPLFAESEATVRARMDADVNAGLAPTDEDYVDTRQGQFYQIVTQPFVSEIARLYDETSTRAAAAFLPFAWGDYLDYHGEMLGTPRKPGVAATGVVTFAGTNGTIVPSGILLSPVQTDPSVTVPAFRTTATGTVAGGSVDVPVECTEIGTIGNVSATAIAVISPPGVAGIASVNNAAPTTGGTDVEGDEAYRDRMLIEFGGQGAGNVDDYERWALGYPGVGRVTVQPAWNGAGTVRLVVATADGSPVAAGVTAGLQALLDPTPGLGHGLAPVGAVVTVTTSTVVTVNVAAAVAFETGYSLDGTGGTTALRAALTAVVRDYGDHLDVGASVVKNHIEGQFFRIKGVHDVTVTLPAADVAINGATTPPEVAKIGTVTLT